MLCRSAIISKSKVSLSRDLWADLFQGSLHNLQIGNADPLLRPRGTHSSVQSTDKRTNLGKMFLGTNVGKELDAGMELVDQGTQQCQSMGKIKDGVTSSLWP